MAKTVELFKKIFIYEYFADFQKLAKQPKNDRHSTSKKSYAIGLADFLQLLKNRTEELKLQKASLEPTYMLFPNIIS